MLRTILVGLDGSDDCAPAIELGIRWARSTDSLLIGIGVVDEPTIRGAPPAGKVSPSYQAAYDQLLSHARRNVELALERFAIRCSEEQVACKLLEDEGQPCERILQELQRFDLLLLGCATHFRHGSERHPCKTLEHVLRHAPRPVVAVPHLPPSDGEIVLVAYDGSVQAARTLQALCGTGLIALGTPHVVTVHHDSALEAARTADRAIEYLRFRDIEAARVPLVGPAPARQFLDYARRHNTALIAMGAYGQPKMAELLFGSATCEALRHSPVPLFLYH